MVPPTDDADPGRNGSSLPHMARYQRCYSFSVFNAVKIVIAELFFFRSLANAIVITILGPPNIVPTMVIFF